MTTMQILKTTEQQEWTKIFPESVQLYKQSLKFTKQLTAMAFSCISYMRGMFPEEAYLEKRLGGCQVKILTGQYICKEAYFMTRCLKSALDAFEKQYMRHLILEILSTDKKIIEYYAAEFSYSGEEAACSLSSGSSRNQFHSLNEKTVQESTKALIFKLLNLTEDLPPLPKDYYLRFKIFYYDERTPTNYLPKYFSQGTNESLDDLNHFHKNEIGKVATPHHEFSMRFGALANLNIQKNTKDLEVNERLVFSEPIAKPSLSQSESEMSNTEPLFHRPRNNDIFSGMDWNYLNSRNKIVMDIKCVCTLQFNRGDLFKCEHCNSWQHYVCYKIKPGSEDPENSCCYTCAKANSELICTDPSLMQCNSHRAKEIAIYRQMINQCHGARTISVKAFTRHLGTTDKIITNLVTQLVNEGFIRTMGNSPLYGINSTKIEEEIKTFLDRTT